MICRVRRRTGRRSRYDRRRRGVICPVGRPVGRTPRHHGGRTPGLAVGRATGFVGLTGRSVGRSGAIPNGRICRVIQGRRGRNVPRAAGDDDRTGRRRRLRRDVRRTHRSGRRAHRAINRCCVRYWRIQQRPRRRCAEDRRRAGTARKDSYVTRLMRNALCPGKHEPTYSGSDCWEQVLEHLPALSCRIGRP